MGRIPLWRTVTSRVTLSPRCTARPDSPEETVIVREAHSTAISPLSMANRISAPPKRKMGLPVEKAASSSAKATASGRVRRVFIA